MGEIKDDLISRQAAIEAVSKECMELRGVFGRCEDALKALPSAQPEDRCGECDAWNQYKNYPSAQPERKKGEWVGVHAYCDHLNEEAKVNGRTDRYIPSGMMIGVYCNQCWCRADKKSDFCPNCGADMRG